MLQITCCFLKEHKNGKFCLLFCEATLYMAYFLQAFFQLNRTLHIPSAWLGSELVHLKIVTFHLLNSHFVNVAIYRVYIKSLWQNKRLIIFEVKYSPHPPFATLSYRHNLTGFTARRDHDAANSARIMSKVTIHVTTFTLFEGEVSVFRPVDLFTSEAQADFVVES